MCKYYKKNTCSNTACGFAHEGDKFPKLVQFTRLKKNGHALSESPVEIEAEKTAKEKEIADKHKETQTAKELSLMTEFDHMFHQLGKGGNRGKIGGKEEKGGEGEDDLGGKV
jgi:hypothetical protein